MIENVENIGDHYALTLKRWREAFFENIEQVRQMEFDETFIRMWDYYLASCEAAFYARYLGDLQLVLTRKKNVTLSPGLY